MNGAPITLRLVVGLGLLVVAACDRGGGSAAAPGRGARVGGTVAAVVDGEAITVGEVRAELARAGGTPLDALHRVEARLLLAHEAARQGIGAGGGDEFLDRRALVQRLLRDVEREHPPSSVTDDEVRRVFAESHARWDRPERRTSAHLVVSTDQGPLTVADAAAKGLAERLVGEARASADPVGLLRARAEAPSGFEHVELRFEELPAFDRSSPIDPSYRDSLFETAAAGVVPRVVWTPFGYNIVVVTGIEPALVATLDTHLETVRGELIDQHRFRALDALTASLRERFPIRFREATVSRLLGDDALFARIE